MSNINFVFFHIGDVTQPQLLTHSIKKFNPDAKIFFVTDCLTENIVGVTETFRFNFDRDNLMISRLKAFSLLELNEPSIYIDTDVLLVRPIPEKLFQGNDIFLCNRSYGKDFFVAQPNSPNLTKLLDLSEYKNKTFGEIYPFIACFTYASNYNFWSECYKTLLNLDEKFHYWYGDQEALRVLYERNFFNIGLLDEKIICTLPEYSKPGDGSYSIHFKGPKRKNLMLQAADFILSDRYIFDEKI